MGVWLLSLSYGTDTKCLLRGGPLQFRALSLSKSPFYPQLKFQHVTILKKGLQNPGRIFTVSELEKDFNVSATAARGYLNALVKMKLLLKTKEGKTFLFIAPSDLRQKLGI